MSEISERLRGWRAFYYIHRTVFWGAEIICFLLIIMIMNKVENQENVIAFSGEMMEEGYLSEEGYACIDETFEYGGVFLNIPLGEMRKGKYKVFIDYETDYSDNGFILQDAGEGKNVINGDVSDEIRPVALKFYESTREVYAWFSENAETYLKVNFCGAGYLKIKGIKICEVPDYTSVIVFAVLLLIVNVKLYETEKLSKGERKEKDFVRAGILCIVAVSCIPLLQKELINGHDLAFHLYRLRGIAEGLLSGQFPVRIQPEWRNGYGYGVSLFYGEALLYIPAFLLILGYKFHGVYKFYIILLNFLTAGISYYCFRKIADDNRAALLGAFLYTLNPYRLIDIYVRAAVGEYTAIAFLPLVVLGIYLIKEKRGWLYLALGLTGCIQSHMLTCEMTALFFIVFAVLKIKWLFQKDVIKNLLKAGMAALFWNLWFIIPLLDMMRGNYNINGKAEFIPNIQYRGVSIKELFGLFVEGFLREDPTQSGHAVGMALGLGLLMALLVCCINKRKEGETDAGVRKTLILFMALSLLALYMTTAFFPYDALCGISEFLARIIMVIQFPWRFLVFAALFSALATVLGFVLWKRTGKCSRGRIGFSILLVILTLVGTTYLYSGLLEEETGVMMECNEASTSEYSILDVLYLHRGTDKDLTEQNIIAGSAEVDVNEWHKKYTNLELVCNNMSSQESYIDVPLFFYPCYKAKDVETGTSLALTYGENNRIRVMLPPNYEGTILLKVSERKLWRLAEVISLISILVSVYWIAGGKNFKDISGKLRKKETAV